MMLNTVSNEDFFQNLKELRDDVRFLREHIESQESKPMDWLDKSDVQRTLKLSEGRYYRFYRAVPEEHKCKIGGRNYISRTFVKDFSQNPKHYAIKF